VYQLTKASASGGLVPHTPTEASLWTPLQVCM